VPVEEVRDTVGHDREGSTGRRVLGNGLAVSVENFGIVVTHVSDIDGSLRVRKTIDCKAGILNTLVYCLKKQSLLWVDCVCFGGRDVEELCVEDPWVFLEEICVKDVAGAMVVAILVPPVVRLEAVNVA